LPGLHNIITRSLIFIIYNLLDVGQIDIGAITLQVTAATAISERPKLKSKPRKAAQLQNQGHGSGPSNQGSTSAGTSPGSSSEKSQTLSPIGSPGSPLSPAQGQGVTSTVPATPVGVTKGPALPHGAQAPTGMVMYLSLIPHAVHCIKPRLGEAC